LVRGYNMGKIPYIIMTPDYRHNSAGIRVLHLLCTMLNKQGYEAYITAEKSTKGNKSIELNSDKLKQLILDGSIVVYPDKYQKNILHSWNPVGWELNTVEFAFEREGLIFTYDLKYGNHELFTIIDTEEFFNNDKKYERKGNLVYVGKGTIDARVNEIPELTIINSTEPDTRKKLAELLKRSKMLYTYDSRTMITTEAILCGCPVTLLENGRNTLEDFSKNSIPSPDNNEAQLINFIKKTQEWALQRNEERKHL